MNNPTPIKRHQALVAFSRDHHFGLLLVWKIKQGLDHAVTPERINNYVLHFFEQDLQQHFEEEEEKLFPILPVDNVLRLQAEKEHAILKGLIDQIRTEPSNKDLAMQFAHHLDKHIRFEERELFAVIQEVAGDQELEKLNLHNNNRGSEVDSGWNDQFWVVKNKSSL